jgi:hypothetical protein
MTGIRGVAFSTSLSGGALAAVWGGAVSPLQAIVSALALSVVFALWEGARPEVVSFGRDAAATVFIRLRSRLNIHAGPR